MMVPGANDNDKEKYLTQKLELLVGRRDQIAHESWRKRSIPTHSEWLYPLTFDAGKGLKEA